MPAYVFSGLGARFQLQAQWRLPASRADASNSQKYGCAEIPRSSHSRSLGRLTRGAGSRHRPLCKKSVKRKIRFYIEGCRLLTSPARPARPAGAGRPCPAQPGRPASGKYKISGLDPKLVKFIRIGHMTGAGPSCIWAFTVHTCT